MYRKPTHTGVFLNFAAMVPNSWRKSVLYGAFYRAYSYCSSTELFNEEVAKLKSMFFNNGYPHGFFNDVLAKFLESRDIPKVDIIEEQHHCNFTIPFIGKPSVTLRRSLTTIFKEHFGVEMRGAFKSCKIGEFFSLKSSIPHSLRANVVYKFTCRLDAATFYIGKTKRQLARRVLEHLRPADGKDTAVTTHLRSCIPCQSVDVNDFSILRSCSNNGECLGHEALLIKRLKPPLNTQLHESGTETSLKIF